MMEIVFSITMLGLPQDLAHALGTTMLNLLSSVVARLMSLVQPLDFSVLSLETRKTYRAVFSEPRLVILKSTDDVVESSTRETNNPTQHQRQKNVLARMAV